MKNQTVRKQSIHEQVFNEMTVYRASVVYKTYINHRLSELNEAMALGCTAEVESLKMELNHLRRNLEELGDVDELTERMEQVERITAPTSSAVIQSRIQVLTPKNVSKALAVYEGYTDVYLDVLFTAMNAGDTERVAEVKTELEQLRKNIAELKGANI